MNYTNSRVSYGDLVGKVAMVTGGAQGIGRKVAEFFIQQGAKVLIFDLDKELAQQTAMELCNDPSVVASVGGNVACREDVHHAVQTCLDNFGRLDIMVAHAGIATAKPLLEIDDDSWNNIMSVNLTGVFLCTQEAGRVMAKAGGGVIIATASTNSFWVESNLSHYNTSKGGVVAFVRSAAIDLAKHGIRVNGVAPGVVRTRISSWVIDDPELSRDYLSKIPLNRFAEPEDVAQTVLFLASDTSSYVTGQTIIVDGGQTLGVLVEEPKSPIPGGELK